MIPKIPKKYCPQSIELRLIKGKDKWQNPVYESKITIQNVIFQQEYSKSGTNNGRKVVANAIAFLFAGGSTPMPTLTQAHVGSELIFEGQTFTVNKIIPNYEPTSNALYSYELEVM